MRKLKKSIYAKCGEKQKEKPDGLIPLYEAGGYAPAKNKQKLMKPLCFLGVVVLFLLAIYLPEILYSNPEPDTFPLPTVSIPPTRAFPICGQNIPTSIRP